MPLLAEAFGRTGDREREREGLAIGRVGVEVGSHRTDFFVVEESETETASSAAGCFGFFKVGLRAGLM